MDPKKKAQRAGLIWVALFAVTFVCAMLTYQGGAALQTRPWLVVLALLAAANVPVLMHAMRLSRQWSTAHPEAKRRRDVALRKGSKRAIQLWTLGLIGWLTAIGILLPATVTASAIGSHHGQAVATSARAVSHYRGPTEVFVEFTTSQGQLVSTKLRAAGQDERSYQPGMVIYYDSTHPEVAISRADYHDGDALGPTVMVTATVVFGLWTYLTFRFIRRRGLTD